MGISTPTRARPGIGASIRIWPVGAARARARSFWRAVILDNLVPRAISRAYWVTAGPKFTSTTRALIPKDSRVLIIHSGGTPLLLLYAPQVYGSLGLSLTPPKNAEKGS